MSKPINQGRWMEDKKPGMPKRINLTEVAWLVTEICVAAWVRLELLCLTAGEMQLEPEDATREVLVAIAASLPKMDPMGSWETSRGAQAAWMGRMERVDDGLSDLKPDDRRWDVVQRIVMARVEELHRKNRL